MRLTIRTLLLLTLFSFSLSPTAVGSPGDWAWKAGRESIVKIAEGRLDAAVKEIEKHLAGQPKHGEALFCLAVARAQQGNIEGSMDCVKRSIESGVPFARYLAGPQKLLRPLTESKEFQRFAASQPEVKLIHGPLLGSVTDRSARVWVRAARAGAAVHVRFRRGEEEWKTQLVEVAGGRDRTAVVPIEKLEPSTEYEYRVFVDDVPCSDWRSFRTFPPRGKGSRFKIAFGGGAAYTPPHEYAFEKILAQRPLAFLQLGDNVYIDQPTRPEVQRYCYYRRQSSAPYRALTASTNIAAIWDDHDFCDNDGWGGPEIETPPWKRRTWEVFRENWNNDYYGGGEDVPGCWFDFEIGDVHFIMLDCRYYRMNPKLDSPSMLGHRQKRWLYDTLRRSRGTFKVISSSVPFASGVKPGSRDPWDGYPGEREEIFSFVERADIEGVVLLAADRHRSDAWRIERPNGYDFYEFMSSRLTNTHVHKVIPGSLFGYNAKQSFGIVEFDTTKPDPELTYKIFTIDAEPVWEITVKRSQLAFEVRRF